MTTTSCSADKQLDLVALDAASTKQTYGSSELLLAAKGIAIDTADSTIPMGNVENPTTVTSTG